MMSDQTTRTALIDDGPSPVAAKWGEAINAGYQIVPDVLLKHQSRLGLTARDMLVLLNLSLHWWFPERHPYPRPTMIARRMGVSARTVQRALNRLTELGFIERVRDAGNRNGDHPSTVIHLAGLVCELEALAIKDTAYRPRAGVLPSRTAGPRAG